MALHLLKLSVGATSIGDLEAWIAACRARSGRADHVHTTRMTPKRKAELLEGGSIYWVIKGQVSARQEIVDLVARTGADGIARCDIVLRPTVTAVRSRACRPFQGWRYMSAPDAPADVPGLPTDAPDMPEAMVRDLRDLGLL